MSDSREVNLNPGLEILMAEDDAGHATLIRNNLKATGIVNPIHHFADGQAVLDFLMSDQVAQGTVDAASRFLLLLDIRMPKVSGEEVLRRIRDHPHLNVMPVIILTTTDDPREIRRCHELGCNEYITKPIEYDQFVAVIQRLGLFLQIVRVPSIRA